MEVVLNGRRKCSFILFVIIILFTGVHCWPRQKAEAVHSVPRHYWSRFRVSAGIFIKKLKKKTHSPSSCSEVLRVLDSLQLTAVKKVLDVLCCRRIVCV